FEPDRDNFRSLMAHVELNGLQGVVNPVNAAVGAVDGEVGFTNGRDVENRVVFEERLQSATVPAVRLDSFFDGQRLDILKVDVEGFEEEVLKGGRELLMDSQRAPRLIYLEV